MPKMIVDIDKKIDEKLKLTSSILRINERELVRNILARGTEEQINNLMRELTTLYVNKVLTEKDLERIVGKSIANKIETIKEITEKGFKDVKKWVR